MPDAWIDRSENARIYPLSSSVGELASHYDVVVVGSGYGGAIVAARLAERGADVCLLERGREFLPGAFPSTAARAFGEFQIDTGARRWGPLDALFDLRLSGDVGALVGCGLGGTSLINAGVCLRPDPRVFADDCWPEELEAGRALNEHYAVAEQLLGARTFPRALSAPRKLQTLERGAKRLGLPVTRVPVSVSFESGRNGVGVDQPACNQCGDCCSGCNSGAKNTTLVTYLPEAKRRGAAIFTQVSVESVSREGDGWLVHVASTVAGSSPRAIAARIVVLAAGTLGSTEILLRSRARGLRLSDELGKGFSGNGDLLAFAYDCAEPVFGVGAGPSDPFSAGTPGPCICGGIDARDPDALSRSRLIEEGVIPGPLNALIAPVLAALARRTVASERPNLLESLWDSLSGARGGATSRTLTLLVMGHDDGAGRLRLNRRTGLGIEWPSVREKSGVEHSVGLLRRLSESVGATFASSSDEPLPLLTVHPLGGCRMAASAERGVVDHKGRVFSDAHGSAVHDGLYVCDGSVIPRSLGANPLLTISAIAERTAALLLEDHEFLRRERAEESALKSLRAAPGLRFSEVMRGRYEKPAPERPLEVGSARAGARAEGARAARCEVYLTLSSPDLPAFLRSEPHTLSVAGEARFMALGSEVFEIRDGQFRLFPEDPADPNVKRMEYELPLFGREGECYLLRGHKSLHDDVRELWKETTTLRFWLHEGTSAQAPVVAGGFLQITLRDFLTQLQTISIPGARSQAESLTLKASFGRFFVGNLFRIYGGIACEEPSLGELHLREKRPLRAPPPEVDEFEVSGHARADGSVPAPVTLRLTRYAGGPRGPVVLAPGFGVTAASFATDTVRTNLVEFLTERGYDVWLFDYRASPALVSSTTDFSLDDIAEFDWPAAVARVEQRSGASGVQVVAHCVGSMTLLMGLLAGRFRVRSAVCSQLGVHAQAYSLSRIASAFDVATRLRSLGVKTVDVHRHDRALDRLDEVLRILPVPHGEECERPTCRRIFSIFGPSYAHARLSPATHAALAEMFGMTGVPAFEHISRIVRHGHVVDRCGRNSYLTLERLPNLEFPIAFLAGEDNRLFAPRSTEKTLELLSTVNGPGYYERHVAKAYAHMDCFIGDGAEVDIFPWIEAQLARTSGKGVAGRGGLP